MYLRRVHLFACALLLTLSVAVQADKVDDYVKAQMERQHVPGVSIVVIKDQKIIKSMGYGLANVELNVAVTPETVFKIGSVSKQFIATGILLLVQDGKMSLDDNISKFLDGTPEPWKPITIRHLLTHTSGIVREAPGFVPLKIQSDADVIKTAYSLPLRFTPGEKWLINLQGQYLDADWGDFGDYEGSISRANAAVEYRFTPVFGAFVGYDWFKLDATREGRDGSLGLDHRFKGPVAGVSFSF